MEYVILAVAVLMYAVIIIFTDKKAFISLGAALLIILLAIFLPQYQLASPFVALTQFVNWNVLFIYIGSLVIADLFLYSKAPIYIADKIIIAAPSVGLGIVLILIFTGLVSAFVENVATVLLMAPIAISLCRRLKINPTFFMVGLAVMANLQGTATLVGDPPSMIFAAQTGYSFGDFFFHNGKPSIFFAVQVGMIVGAIFFYFYFKKNTLKEKDIEIAKVTSVVPSILLIALIIGLALISFIFNHNSLFYSGMLCMVLAVIGLIWYVFIRKEGLREAYTLVKKLDWETILFLIGIFIVIGYIERAGLLESFAHFLNVAIGDNVTLAFIVIVLISLLISGFVDNVPYIIAMLPVAASLAAKMNYPQEVLMFGLLIGSCLGGNLTPFGASANIVAMGILKKEGYPMTFASWLKIGAPFTIMTTIAASLFVYFVWG